jgi:hypothetical protein
MLRWCMVNNVEEDVTSGSLNRKEIKFVGRSKEKDIYRVTVVNTVVNGCTKRLVKVWVTVVV